MTTAVGRTTVESIQSGLFWSNVGMVKELVATMSAEVFPDDAPFVIGTGGLRICSKARRYLSMRWCRDLILEGLRESGASEQLTSAGVYERRRPAAGRCVFGRFNLDVQIAIERWP